MQKLPARKTTPIAAAVLLWSGCFSYMPADPGALPVGSHVRVQLTRLGVAALPEVLDQSGPRLAGTLVWTNNDQLMLRVPAVVDPSNAGLGQQVVIPTQNVVSFETRRFSSTRTALVVGGGITLAALLYAGLESGRPANPEDPEEPEVEGMRAGFLRILSIPVR
jgi:hypothetical protein